MQTDERRVDSYSRGKLEEMISLSSGNSRMSAGIYMKDSKCAANVLNSRISSEASAEDEVFLHNEFDQFLLCSDTAGFNLIADIVLTLFRIDIEYQILKVLFGTY